MKVLWIKHKDAPMIRVEIEVNQDNSTNVSIYEIIAETPLIVHEIPPKDLERQYFDLANIYYSVTHENL